MASDEVVNRPRLIDTSQYVKDRILQIAELLEVVDNSSLVAGEVTAGPRTILQRLPRHMRRRAMSHNIKRLPRNVRDFAARAVKKTRHRKKAPCRKWKRRPSRLLKRRTRTLRESLWLETHIWHAKRFLMRDLWGYRLPVRSYQKGFRPTYRSSIGSAVVFDQSFLQCIQITSSKSSERTVACLSKLCEKFVSVGFGFKPALDGSMEMGVLLYEPDRYPHGFLGPARFSWSCSSIQLWTHPSSYSSVLENVRKVIQPEEISNGFKITELRHQVGRIQLVGPKAFDLLLSVFRLVSNKELIDMGLSDSFSESHEYWCKQSKSVMAGNLRNGSVISLLVEDPRLFRPIKAQIKQLAPISCCDPPAPCQLFWDQDFCKQQFNKRLSKSAIQKEQIDKLAELKTTPFKVPVLLVIRSEKSCALINRIDLLVPGGTVLDFWVALQFAGGRAAGLQDKVHLDFESGLTSFPSDCADSKAGRNFAEVDCATQMATYRKRPKNRRIKYETGLGIKYPFSFNWRQLVDDWCKAKTSEVEFYVIRDKRMLLKLCDWLNGKVSRPEEVFAENTRGLVCVKLEQISRGKQKRMALICLPNAEDRILMNSKGNIIQEGDVKLKNKDLLISENNKPLTNFLPLSGSNQMLVSLNQMFPDQESLQLKRNIQKRTKKKVAAKKRQLLIDENSVQELSGGLEELEKVDSYRNSCSRTVIGRIVRGDHSFAEAHGIAFGYCPISSLEHVKDRIVLLRNISSKFYHPAKISIVIHQSDL